MSPRLPLLAASEAPPLARRWYGHDGVASPLTRSLAAAPDVMETALPFLADVLGESALDLATKELVIMRVSHLNGCRYCIGAHRGAAEAAGIAGERLAAVLGDAPLDVLTPRERTILAWVDTVTLDPAAASDELAGDVVRLVRDDGLVELTLLAGAVGMLNRYCTALDLPAPA
jgi:AhpD family alkylhydroperoxidase